MNSLLQCDFVLWSLTLIPEDLFSTIKKMVNHTVMDVDDDGTVTTVQPVTLSVTYAIIEVSVL